MKSVVSVADFQSNTEVITCQLKSTLAKRFEAFANLSTVAERLLWGQGSKVLAMANLTFEGYQLNERH